MRTITTNLFNFSELSEDAKSKAIESLRVSEHYPHENWYEHVKEDFHKILEIVGMHNVESYFSHSCSQGDGACFTGRYSYKLGMLKSIKAYAPKDTELHEIVKKLMDLMKPYKYQLACNILHRGNYSHSNTMSFNFEINNNYYFDFKDNATEEQLKDVFKSLADWYFNRIVCEYEYYQSDEAIIQHIEGNEYEFLDSGEIV